MNQEQLNEQLTELFGPPSPFSEHKAGDTVIFRHGPDIKTGKVIHVRRPGPAIQDGKEHPLLYMVDTGKGFPVPVASTQIIYGSFPVILASYGASMDGCMLSRKAAENLAENVEGQIIDTDQGRLKVLSARIEGDDQQGQVMAECEAVSEEEQGES